MHGTNWEQSEYHARGASVEEAIQKTIQTDLRKHAVQLLKGIALILIVVMAIDLLVLATLALVGLN
jgi:hypothetical protein